MLTEGEKDVETIRRMGMVATTAPNEQTVASGVRAAVQEEVVLILPENGPLQE